MVKNNFYFISSFSNIYKNPSKTSEVTSQIIYGEKFKILARKKAYQNAQKTLWEESGTMIPYHVSKLVVTSSKVKNLDEVEVFSVRWHKVKVD